MSIYKFFVFATLLSMQFLWQMDSVTYAAIESFSDKGEYIMEDNQILKEAQDIVYKEAMRSIAQQVGVSISGNSQANDNELTQGELEMMATTIAKVKEKTFKQEIVTDGKVKVMAFVSAEIDTEQASRMLKDLVEARIASKSYEQILVEYTKKQGQYGDLQR